MAVGVVSKGCRPRRDMPSSATPCVSHCVSDYRANCASVPTGGMAALVCLGQHIEKLSPSCQAAVRAAAAR